jgi:plastocyanin
MIKMRKAISPRSKEGGFKEMVFQLRIFSMQKISPEIFLSTKSLGGDNMKKILVLLSLIAVLVLIVGCGTPEVVEEVVDEVVDEPVEIVEEVVEEVVETAEVKVTKDGFVPDTLNVKVGTIVTWENVDDDKKYDRPMILGTQKCIKLKTDRLEAGESYSFTFEEAMECKIVNGILPSQTMKVVVE